MAWFEKEKWRKTEKLFYVTACECMHLHVFLLVHANNSKKDICVYSCTHRTQIDAYCVFAPLCVCVRVCMCTFGRLLLLALSDTCLVCLWGAWPMLKASSVLSTARLNVYTSVRKRHGSDSPLPHSSFWMSSAITLFIAAILHQQWRWFICWSCADLWEWEGSKRDDCVNRSYWHYSLSV